MVSDAVQQILQAILVFSAFADAGPPLPKSTHAVATRDQATPSIIASANSHPLWQEGTGVHPTSATTPVWSGGDGKSGNGRESGAPAPCIFNQHSIPSGQLVKAYQAAIAPYGQKCVMQERTCINGALSGSYANESCIAAAATANGCAIWPSSLDATLPLQMAVTMASCVSVAAGAYMLQSGITLPAGHTLRSASAAQTALKADPQAWQIGATDAIVSSAGPNAAISDLTLDGSGVATYNFIGHGTTIQNSNLKNSRCSAVGTGGAGLVVRGNRLENSGQPTAIPGRGTFTCASNPNNIPDYGGVLYGGGIYVQGSPANYNLAPVIEGNIIINSYGPALDINTVNGGVVTNNVIYGSASEAAINLFQSSGWRIADNKVSHPADAATSPTGSYHPSCVGGPNGPHAAAIELCSDGTPVTSGAVGQPATKNKLSNNYFSSFYGILLLGAGSKQNPSLSPYGNDIENNHVYGSSVACADGFNPAWGTAAVPANTWKGNDCAGPAAPPSYFK
jgi:hypothetical protein